VPENYILKKIMSASQNNKNFSFVHILC